MTDFINLTPHVINLNDGTSYASRGIARVSNTFSSFNDDGICEVHYGDIINLPKPRKNTVYIVSAMVLAAAKAAGRTDCVAPATGHPDCVRKDGVIVSVPGFVKQLYERLAKRVHFKEQRQYDLYRYGSCYLCF